MYRWSTVAFTREWLCFSSVLEKRISTEAARGGKRRRVLRAA